jgi:CheY-like chemotaxis protein
MPRVMIVEDDLTILDNLGELLELTGLDVIKAHDGQEAWRLLLCSLQEGLSLPAMIVSDLMMPNMDGLELLKLIRAHEQLKAMPFVLLSARSDPSDLQQAFTAGASDYLVKPFELDQLMEVIRHNLSAAGRLKRFPESQPSGDDDAFVLE